MSDKGDEGPPKPPVDLSSEFHNQRHPEDGPHKAPSPGPLKSDGPLSAPGPPESAETGGGFWLWVTFVIAIVTLIAVLVGAWPFN